FKTKVKQKKLNPAKTVKQQIQLFFILHEIKSSEEKTKTSLYHLCSGNPSTVGVLTIQRSTHGLMHKYPQENLVAGITAGRPAQPRISSQFATIIQPPVVMHFLFHLRK